MAKNNPTRVNDKYHDKISDRLVRNQQDLWAVYVDVRSGNHEPDYQRLMGLFAISVTELGNIIAYSYGKERLSLVRAETIKFGLTILPGLVNYLDMETESRLRRVVNDVSNTLQIGYASNYLDK